MKKELYSHHSYASLSEAHQAMGLPGPKHPLISLINNSNFDANVQLPTGAHVLHFYKISFKPNFKGRVKYGQGYYDFNEGGFLFAAPGQVLGSEDNNCADRALYTLLIHPDFLLHYPLAKSIKQYGFFSYSADEALHVSEEEKEAMISIFKMIDTELNSRIDDFSQNVMIAHIELLLNYANRFYNRQFITRKAVNNDLLLKLEELVDDYFKNDTSSSLGVPTVQYLAEELHLTPSYLSDMLRSLIGQNAQQFIHDRLFDKAKELLSTTNLSVSEVAFELGFEHSQSFSRFFKIKAKVSPVQFRQSFN